MWMHSSSHVHFIDRHKIFRLGPIYCYDESGHNISVRYVAGTTALVTVYVFPSAEDHSSSRAAVVGPQVFRTAVDNMIEGLASALWVHERATAFACGAGEVVQGRRVEAMGYLPGYESPPCFSLVELFTFRGWMLKFRATHYQPDLHHDIEDFLCAWLSGSQFGRTSPIARTVESVEVS